MCLPQKCVFVWRYTSPGQHKPGLGQAQPIPTPVMRTQARGGCSASATALAKVLVVSTRLLMTSLQKASPHLGKGKSPITLPAGSSKETIAPRQAPTDTLSQAQEGRREFPPPHPRAGRGHEILLPKCMGTLGDGGSLLPTIGYGVWIALGQRQQRSWTPKLGVVNSFQAPSRGISKNTLTETKLWF